MMKKRKRKSRMSTEMNQEMSAKISESPGIEMEAETRATDAAEAPTQEPEGAETPEEEKADDAEEALRKQLEDAQAKTAEYLAMAQRIQADFENFRRRNESVRADAYADGRREVAADMLPVLDNLERAAEAAEKSNDEALKNGVLLVLKQMNDIYGKMEVVAIDRPGEKFDPNLENAILQGTMEEGEPGTVCQVLQKGYRMGDRVLRHAMVKVVPE